MWNSGPIHKPTPNCRHSLHRPDHVLREHSPLSKAEKAYIQSALAAQPALRADGFRPVALQTDVALLANGSARVRIGGGPARPAAAPRSSPPSSSKSRPWTPPAPALRTCTPLAASSVPSPGASSA